MTVQCFARWCETAPTVEREQAAAIVCRNLNDPKAEPRETEVALALLSVLLGDPSPKVRRTIAEALCRTAGLPRSVLLPLCDASDSIACLIAGRSPALGDDDLIDLVTGGSTGLCMAIAGRAVVSVRVCAAIAEIAELSVCSHLLANDGAAISSLSYRRIAERFSHEVLVRGALLDRDDLPVAVRQRLIGKTAEALSQLDLLVNLVGEDRASRVVSEASEKATACLADIICEAEGPALIEHLRLSGQLNTAFLLRILCAGHIDLLTCALVRLSALPEHRVRAILSDPRRRGLETLFDRCGLPMDALPIVAAGLAVWRDIARGKALAHAEDVPQMIIERLATDDATPSIGFWRRMQVRRAFDAEPMNGHGREPLESASPIAFMRRLSGEGLRAKVRAAVPELAA